MGRPSLQGLEEHSSPQQLARLAPGVGLAQTATAAPALLAQAAGRSGMRAPLAARVVAGVGATTCSP